MGAEVKIGPNLRHHVECAFPLTHTFKMTVLKPQIN